MNPLATKSTLNPGSTTSSGSVINSVSGCPETPPVQAPQRRTEDRDASVTEKIGAGEATAAGKPGQNNQEEENEEINDYDPRNLGIYKLSLILIGLNLSVFLIGLDNTIISTAIPKITDNFHALGDVGWYASSYLLTTCAFQLMWGELYTLYSIKWTYITALFIFELGSLICAVAPNSTSLIAGRAIAGVGSGGVTNGAFLLVAHLVLPRQRPTLVGMIGGMYGFASIAGPLMGGAFTDNTKLTWRWCFYINLPLGLITGLIMTFVYRPRMRKGRKISLIDQLKQMDLPGTAVILLGVIFLVLALRWGGTKYEWKNRRIIALLAIAAALLVGFVIIQIISGDRATVPPRVFCNRNIWGSALFGSGVTACFFTMLYYIPIWFQAIKGVSAVKSGVMNLPMILSFVIFSFLGGTLTSLTGYYVQFTYLTVILMAIGTGLLTTLKVDSGHPEWIGYQFILGAGIGLGLQAAFVSTQTALPLEDIPIGTATIMFSENLAAAIMVSVAQNVFTNQLMRNLGTHVPGFDGHSILTIGATQIKNKVPPELYDAVLIAYNRSLAQTFYVGVGLSCIGLLGVVWLEWLSVNKVKDKLSDAAQGPP
ncbi:MFS transporter [Paracoccidioides lutzii Pb01]|uniref:MFS transporter n=1 Tax=Paracoccidioides lutzii (strain ATCC MYA-826 / Pb01) TaxID=502779 RepID=C1H033_PARBA|nr:MFS transporter [Paracoccidioides lutzii Pb01]EEH33074.1 MFS transporter [Paracoccidioides lutzii Pb01]